MAGKNKHPVGPVGSTERNVFTIGQSVAITLPKEFVDAHGIKAGDKVSVAYDSFLLLQPKDRRKILKEIETKRKELERGRSQ